MRALATAQWRLPPKLAFRSRFPKPHAERYPPPREVLENVFTSSFVCLAGCFVGCAVVLAVGCSDDNSKKVKGEAGEAGEAAGGSSAGTSSAGSGGAAPSGGEAGTPGEEVGPGGAPTTGAAGAPEAGGPEAGAGGEPTGTVACMPTGTTDVLTFQQDGPLTVCRGARVESNFTATTGLQTFTCCGVSDSATPYAVELVGTTLDAGGTISLVVPDDAPSGAQSISATCSSGATTNALAIDVTDTPPPVVTGLANSSITADGTLVIEGTNLAQVTRVQVRPVDGSGNRDCFIGGDSTDTSISCAFDGVDVGDYYVFVEETECGFAVNTPSLTITPSL